MLAFLRGVFYTLAIAIMLFVGCCTVSLMMTDTDQQMDDLIAEMDQREGVPIAN